MIIGAWLLIIGYLIPMSKFNTKILTRISWLLGVAIFWLLDIYFKKISLAYLSTPTEHLYTCDSFICFQPTINNNLAFSLPLPLYLILFLNILIGAFLFGWYLKTKGTEKIALLAVILGGLSNLADRLIHNGVVDYIMIGWWPVFNLADALIIAGILWLLYNLIFLNKKIQN